MAWQTFHGRVAEPVRAAYSMRTRDLAPLGYHFRDRRFWVTLRRVKE